MEIMTLLLSACTLKTLGKLALFALSSITLFKIGMGDSSHCGT